MLYEHATLVYRVGMKVGAESVKSFMALLANRDTEMRLAGAGIKKDFLFY